MSATFGLISLLVSLNVLNGAHLASILCVSERVQKSILEQVFLDAKNRNFLVRQNAKIRIKLRDDRRWEILMPVFYWKSV